MGLGLRARLSAMMFLQYMMLPVWFNTIIPYIKTLPGGERWAMWCGMLLGFGTLASPLFGMFADRFLNAEKVLAISDFVYAGLMAGCFFVRDPSWLFVLLLAAAVVNMPGWSISATISMSSSSSADYPSVRVFGSLGWVCSAVFSVVGINWFGLADFDKTPWIFACAAFAGVAGGFVALLQPPMPPAAKGRPMSVVDALGLRALSLFKRFDFAVFTVLLMLAMVPFQWYMAYNAMYLDESGFRYLSLTQNLGQVGELGFMIVVPLIVTRFGYRWAMVLGLSAMALRYGCFYTSVATGCHAFDFGGILIHGLIFSLLIVGAQMYVDDHAPAELRNQAQGLIMTMMTSIGAFASCTLFERLLAAHSTTGAQGTLTHDWSSAYLVAFGMSVAVALLMATLVRDRRRLDRKKRTFVVAMESEAAAVRPFLGRNDEMIVSGVGKVNAAAATARAIAAGAREIWNVGLAGGFGSRVTLGGVYEVARAVEYDFDLAQLNGTACAVKDERKSPYIHVGETGLTLATGDHFDDRETDLELLEKLGCDLRDMEGAAIADVCDKAGVACVMLKCVSDVHGAGSMVGQYRDNSEDCLKRLGETVAARLKDERAG